ncbi:unnamed protein product [Arctogadus glacialis]
MRQADYALVSGGKRPQYIAPIAMRISADLCSEVSGEGNDPEVDGPKRQEARVQEEGHGLLLSPRQAMIGERAGEGVRGRQLPRTMRQGDYALVSGGKRPQYIAPIAMRISADLCSEVSGEGNDPEVDGPKRQEARVQEEGHGLLLSPRQAMIGERAGEGVVK